MGHPKRKFIFQPWIFRLNSLFRDFLSRTPSPWRSHQSKWSSHHGEANVEKSETTWPIGKYERKGTNRPWEVYMLNGRSHAPTMTCIKDWKRSYVAAVFSCKESWYFHMPRSKCCQKPWAKIQGKRRQSAKQMILGIISCTEVSTNHTEMVKANEDASHHIDSINIYKSRIINGSIQDVCQQGSKKVWCDIQSKLRTVNKANSWCCLLLVPFWNILAYLCHGCNSSRSLACQSFKQACDHLWHLFAGFFCLNWVSVLVASPHGEKTIPGK